MHQRIIIRQPRWVFDFRKVSANQKSLAISIGEQDGLSIGLTSNKNNVDTAIGLSGRSPRDIKLWFEKRWKL